MLEVFTAYINPIKVLVLIAFLYGLLHLRWRNIRGRHILILLSVSFISEYSVFILIPWLKTFDPMYSVSIICHHSLWLSLLGNILLSPRMRTLTVLLFAGYGVFNLFFVEGFWTFNYNAFIIGALIYTMLFIVKSFEHLRMEDFKLIESNDYRVLFAPLLFFLGYSFMFGFRNHKVLSVKLVGPFELYDIISYTVNIIYYILVLHYIYRVKREENV